MCVCVCLFANTDYFLDNKRNIQQYLSWKYGETDAEVPAVVEVEVLVLLLVVVVVVVVVLRVPAKTAAILIRLQLTAVLRIEMSCLIFTIRTGTYGPPLSWRVCK